MTKVKNMAKANLKGALARDRVVKFGGICHGGSKNSARKEKGSFNAFDICNFRILPDGSLEKRQGFSLLMELPGEPRAFWSGYLDGDEITFALIGSAVYSVDTESKRVTLLGTVDSSEGRAEFFFYRGFLYLADGAGLYRYDGEDFEDFSGYVPLYGKDWSDRFAGEVYEPVNFLSDKIRITYAIREDTAAFNLGIKCSEILSISVNGNDFMNKVSLGEDGKTIRVNTGSISDGALIKMCLRLDESECSKEELIGVTRATVYGGADDGRILLYGGSDASKVFASRYVSRSSYIESLEADNTSNDVYFPVTDTVSVTDGRYPITALCRHYDRLLIFTAKETWMADFTKTSGSPYIVPINSSVGCLSENGAALGGNSPYTVSEGGIYRWTSDSDERNECNAVLISGEIGDMLDSSFFDHAVAFYLRERGEIWFADPDSDEQQVFIYSVSGQRWYRFDGIAVDRFFSYKGEVGMLYGKYIFAFSDVNLFDSSANGVVKSNIEAYYESNLTDFGYPERVKHLKRVLVTAYLEGEDISITLKGDTGGEQTITIREKEDADGIYPTYLDAHSGIGRFREMNYVIRAEGDGRPRLRALTLSAHK
ncbi:MAG: hypothetical protein E7671_03415 [Ruminococcaceae bacterium]|nr:hypothetical protein [Oscillospiraceae bacterium]